MKLQLALAAFIACSSHHALAVADPAPRPAVPWETAGVDWAKIPPASAEAPFAPPNLEEFTLPNGLRVVVAQRRGVPLVSVALVALQAGAASGTPGLAQLTGDLLTQGADIYTRDTFAERLEELGAVLEVVVGRDTSTVSVRTLAATLEPTLELMARMVANPLLPRGDFERLGHIQLENVLRRDQEPGRMAAFLWHRLAFGAAHPYGNPVIGLPETLRAISLQDVHDFHEQHYQPAAACLIIVGDVAAKDVRKMVDRRFASWQARRPPLPSPRPVAPALPSTSTIYVFDKPGTEQAVIYAGTPHAAHADDQRAGVEVVNTAFGGTFASRLNGTLREQLGYTYGISSSVMRLRAATLLLVSSSIKTANTVDAVRQILAIKDHTRTTPLPDLELQKTKRFLMRSFPHQFETNGDVARALRDIVVQARPLATLRTAQAEIAAVRAEQAQRTVAESWRHFTIVVVGDRAAIGDLGVLGMPVVYVNADAKVVGP
ncbi:MAG: insulinase family protein [Myxococcales bacterium]|nr:insulinase family protein [Myxococcales bacterium]